jgi:hypothetical protein
LEARKMALANPFAALGVEFYGFLLPWIFTFAVVYGLLMKAHLFGDVNAKISVALAFVMAFFVTAAGGPQLADFFITLFGGASAFLAGIIVIILFVSILGYGKAGGDFKHWAALAAVIRIGAALFLVSSGSFGGYVAISSEMASLIFWLVIIVVAVWFVTKEKKEAPAGGKETPK